MIRDANEIAQTDRFNALYELSRSPVLQAISNVVCGCGHIGTSWTTRNEADDIAERLGLQPSSRLLELGAGAGWPGLYLAKQSGCHVTLVDLPEAGIRLARKRAEVDGISHRVDAIVADAADLALEPGSFSAINHSDLLCCLLPKREVLGACRRVIRRGGRMSFSVISIAPDLTAEARQEAMAAGPSFVESELSYSRLLGETGWRVLSRSDLTPAYERDCEAMIAADQIHKTELVALLGPEEYELRQDSWRRTLSAIRRRLTLREFFLVEPD